MLNCNTSDISAVYGLENKAIKFFWHCVSDKKNRSEEMELQKCVLHWRPISSIDQKLLCSLHLQYCVRAIYFMLCSSQQTDLPSSNVCSYIKDNLGALKT